MAHYGRHRIRRQCVRRQRPVILAPSEFRWEDVDWPQFWANIALMCERVVKAIADWGEEMARREKVRLAKPEAYAAGRQADAEHEGNKALQALRRPCDDFRP